MAEVMKEEQRDAERLPEELSASQAEAEDREYTSIVDVWEDIKNILGGSHPIDWVRSPDRGPADNYYDGCRRLWEVLPPGSVDMGRQLPDSVLTKHGGIIAVPVTFAAYAERVGEMTTCWKEVSKVRCLRVLERIFVGGKGLETDTDLPMLVVQEHFRGKTLDELRFACVHAACTTRLMAAHSAMRLILALQGMGRDPLKLPEVMRVLQSLSNMNCHCRLMTASERTVWALGRQPPICP